MYTGFAPEKELSRK